MTDIKKLPVANQEAWKDLVDRANTLEQTITTAGAQTVTPLVKGLFLNNATTAIDATIADASEHQGIFMVKVGLEPAVAEDHSLTLTSGTFDGTNNVATFADIDDYLLVYFDVNGNGTVLINNGTVVLS